MILALTIIVFILILILLKYIGKQCNTTDEKDFYGRTPDIMYGLWILVVSMFYLMLIAGAIFFIYILINSLFT